MDHIKQKEEELKRLNSELDNQRKARLNQLVIFTNSFNLKSQNRTNWNLSKKRDQLYPMMKTTVQNITMKKKILTMNKTITTTELTVMKTEPQIMKVVIGNLDKETLRMKFMR